MSPLDDQHAHFLTPSFALSGTLPDPPSYESMTVPELEAFLTEMEPDIRAADRDMREIEVLEQKGVTGAGKLAGSSYFSRPFFFVGCLMFSYRLSNSPASTRQSDQIPPPGHSTSHVIGKTGSGPR